MNEDTELDNFLKVSSLLSRFRKGPAADSIIVKKNTIVILFISCIRTENFVTKFPNVLKLRLFFVS